MDVGCRPLGAKAMGGTWKVFRYEHQEEVCMIHLQIWHTNLFT